MKNFTFAVAVALLFVSRSGLAQQATSGSATAMVGSFEGPPLERHILSLNEEGNHRMDVVYHADHTCDITVDGTHSWRCTWSIRTTDGAFCFLQDGGADAGKNFCKQGRLIGRVSHDGTSLATAAQSAQTTPTCSAHYEGGEQWCKKTYTSVGLLDECLFETKVRYDRCMQTGVYITNHGNFQVQRQ